MKWEDIDRVLDFAGYSVDIQWSYLEKWIAAQEEECSLEIDPDFQRGHVWTEDQQIAFVEFCLRGGVSGNYLYFNCPNYMTGSGEAGVMVLVDGLQRLTAVRRFMANEIGILGGHRFEDFEGYFRHFRHNFRVNVNELPTREKVLRWYLALNDGGVVHTDSELTRVRSLLQEEL